MTEQWERAGEAVAEIGARLLDRAEEIAAGMTERVREGVPAYRTDKVVTAATLRATCHSHVLAIYGAVGRRVDVGTSESYENGKLRARAGMPLPEVMAAYRICAHHLWEQLAAAVAEAGAPGPVLMRAAADIWQVLDVFTEAMSAGYRDEVTEQVLGQERRRAAVVQALLEGGLTEGGDLWAAADVLRLPHTGPYVVLAAAVGQLGDTGLPRVESRLRAAGIPSVWHLQPEEHLGVAALARPAAQLPQLIDLLDTAAGVGVSPSYQELPETPQALALARIALRAAIPGQPVVVFDEQPLAVVSVAAPEVLRRVTGRVLAGLDGLPDRDRELLLETFLAWLDSGSANEAATALFCHPNTVRYRLRRLEEHTGRDLAVPRDVVELGLAVEADRRARR